MINELTTHRIRSIDAFRGITILVMIFVNDVAGVAGVPDWMKHRGADEDAMSFVDVVFPAFLFIVGMSLPFAINKRLAKGESFWKIQGHILWRTIGLLILGIFMEEEEENGLNGYNEKAMGMSIATWSLLFYVCVFLLWNVYKFKNKAWGYTLQLLGVAGLLVLAWLYRTGADGAHWLKPHWWGILGLIGWAYLYGCIIYQLVKGRILFLILSIAVCIGWYAASRSVMAKDSVLLQWMAPKAQHAIHTVIVLSGMVVSLIFFEKEKNKDIRMRFASTALFALVFFLTAYILRPAYHISKVHATPAWSLYSTGYCILLYSFLYWLIDIKKIEKWTRFFQPAASNSLLVYILPSIIMFVQIEFGLYLLPAAFHTGLLGMIWSGCFALLMMWLAIGLNKLNIRLQL